MILHGGGYFDYQHHHEKMHPHNHGWDQRDYQNNQNHLNQQNPHQNDGTWKEIITKPK